MAGTSQTVMGEVLYPDMNCFSCRTKGERSRHTPPQTLMPKELEELYGNRVPQPDARIFLT